MSIIDAFQSDTDAAVNAMLSAPLQPPRPVEKKSWWADLPNAVGRSLGSAIPAAAAESAAAIGEAVVLTGRTIDTARRSNTREQMEQMKRSGVQVTGRNEFSDTLRNVAQDMRPDPITASTAEQLVFSATKGIAKAVGYTLAGGPLAGAAAFGVDEALTAYDDLQRKDVDPLTAQKVAVTAGLAAGPSILLPVAGSTVAKTAALTLAGGPGLFIAQQQITRDILKDANYAKLAEGYDPLDPIALPMSLLLPGIFAGAHMAGLRLPKAETSPELVDAAMVQNLTLQQDVRASEPDVPPPIEPPRRLEVPDEQPKVAEKDPVAEMRERVAPIEQAKPEAAADLQRARQEAEQGTDTDLGRADAELLRVAAECSLT